MEERYLIIADDFTGANDTGVQQYQKLCNSNAMMQSLIRSSSNQYLILDLEGRCHYSTINDEKEEEFIQSLQKELGKCRTSSRRSFFVTLGNQLYSVRSSLAEEGDFPYIISPVIIRGTEEEPD